MGNENENYFLSLYKIDCTGNVKQKNGLNYLPWASAWAEIKKYDPDATFTYKEMKLDDLGNTRFWQDDGKTGWVEVSMTVKGHTQTVPLPIMDLRNKPIPAENITSVDANKTLLRCLVKAIAFHGLGNYLFKGEDIPEDTINILRLQEECVSLMKKRASLSESAKHEVARLCKEADAEYTGYSVDEVVGNPATINDSAILEKLKMQLRKVRK